MESDSVPGRALQRGAVTRRTIARHAVGRDELQPGIIDGGMLAPRSVKPIHVDPSTVVELGNRPQMILLGADEVVVAPGWQPVAWDGVDATPGRLGYVWDDEQPTEVFVNVGRVHLVHVTLTWAAYQGGGSVRLLVGEDVVWGPDQDPQWTSAAGGQFAGTAILRLAAGDVVTLEVNSGDVSAQTASSVRMQVALPDPAGAGVQPTPPPGPGLPVIGPPPQFNVWLAAVGADAPHLQVTVDTSVPLPDPWPPSGWTPAVNGMWLAAVGADAPHLVALVDTEVTP